MLTLPYLGGCMRPSRSVVISMRLPTEIANRLKANGHSAWMDAKRC